MIYAITNRRLIEGGILAFLSQVEKIAEAGPDGIILREKDMTVSNYRELARQCQEICGRWKTPFMINHFWQVARELGVKNIHLSMAVFNELIEKEGDLQVWNRVGVSVHSQEEAAYAQSQGASYLIAGHIFPTDCKAGVPARGLDFLSQIVEKVTIPVFAIGGMNRENGQLALSTGAAGICLMSGLMKDPKPREIIKRFSGR